MERWETHATIEQACAAMVWHACPPCSLADLLERGLTPWFWLDEDDFYPQAFFGSRRVSHWAQVQFPDGARTLRVTGDHAFVEMFLCRGGMVSGGPGLGVPLGDLGFLWDDLEDVAERAGEPIELLEGDSERPALAAPGQDMIDYSMLATKERLIEAFGPITGMDRTWFDNLTDAPALLAARKVRGRGGRNHLPAFFCPLAVMQWLLDPRRRKGRKISDDKAWQILESHFPKVYHAHSVGDSRAD